MRKLWNEKIKNKKYTEEANRSKNNVIRSFSRPMCGCRYLGKLWITLNSKRCPGECGRDRGPAGAGESPTWASRR